MYFLSYKPTFVVVFLLMKKEKYKNVNKKIEKRGKNTIMGKKTTIIKNPLEQEINLK